MLTKEKDIANLHKQEHKAIVAADSNKNRTMTVRRLPLVKAHVMPTAKLMATVKKPSRIRLTGCFSW